MKGLRLGVVLSLAFIFPACHRESVSLVGGKQVSASAWKNRWVIVTYWADWCEQCQKEIPALNAYANRHSSKVLVFGVNFDGLYGSKLDHVVKKLGIQFPVIDGALPFKVPRPDVLPVTYLLDKQKHRVIKTWVGPEFLVWLKKATMK